MESAAEINSNQDNLCQHIETSIVIVKFAVSYFSIIFSDLWKWGV